MPVWLTVMGNILKTKMMVNKKLAYLNPYRYYCAFFGKKSVCQAIGTSVATAERKAQQKAQQKAH